MGNSRIEWTEKTLPIKTGMFKDHPINKPGVRVKAFILKPVNYISIFFRAVTGFATRDNITWRSVASFYNRGNMIPCFCRGMAISTGVVKLVKQNILTLNWKFHNVSFAACGVLIPFFTIIDVRIIPIAFVLGTVFLALPLSDLINREPVKASGTPRKPNFLFQSPFTLAWAAGFPGIVTGSAFCGKIITTMRIFVKLFNGFPSTTAIAPFKPRAFEFQIFRIRNPYPISCDFIHTNLTTHYIKTFLCLICPFNYTITEVY